MFEAIGDWLKDPGLNILIVLFFGWVARQLGGAVLDRMIRRLIRSTSFNGLSASDVKKRQDTLISLFVVIWKVIVAIVVIFMVFQQLFPQISLTPIFASAGIVGIALGFGAQSIIKDLLSGVFIIMENQYRVGDVVDLEGAAGTVEKITIRSTVVRDIDGNVHYLPNGNIMHVINKTMGFSKVHFSISVSTETNIDELSALIDSVGLKLSEDEKWKDKIIDPPHFINIGTFSDQALEVIIAGKTQPSDQWSVTGEMRKRLLRELNKAHIQLAHLPGSFSLTPPDKKPSKR